MRFVSDGAGYCSMRLRNDNQVITSSIHGCGGVLSWSAFRADRDRSISQIPATNALNGLRKQLPHRILHLSRIPALSFPKTAEQDSKWKLLLEKAETDLGTARQQCQRIQIQLDEKATALIKCNEEIRSLEEQCNQLNNEKFALENRLNQYVQLQEKFLQSNVVEDSPISIAQLQTLLQKSNQEVVRLTHDNEKQRKHIDLMKRQEVKSIKLRKAFSTLKDAHAAQMIYLQSIQEDRKKIDKFYKTIHYQEDVITNLEGMIRSSKIAVNPPPTNTDRPEDESNWKERAINAETRCSALEGELRIAAETYGREIASLQTQLMEANNRPRSADSFLLNEEDVDVWKRD